MNTIKEKKTLKTLLSIVNSIDSIVKFGEWGFVLRYLLQTNKQKKLLMVSPRKLGDASEGGLVIDKIQKNCKKNVPKKG